MATFTPDDVDKTVELTTDDEAEIRAGEDVSDRTDAAPAEGSGEREDEPGSPGGPTTDDGPTPKDAGAIDAEMPGASEQRPDDPEDPAPDEAEAGGEDPDTDLE